MQKYSTGQWYHSADTLSWKVLGAAGLSGDFLGSGSWYDLGNGFTYKYSIGSDKGTFKDDSAYRFLYNYASSQWYHTGDTLSWRALGVNGLDAAFVGNAHWNDLGNGFTYQYSRGYDKGIFRAGSTDRFLYKYVPGQWWHTGDTVSWQALGNDDLYATFLGDGTWHTVGNGFSYKYDNAPDKGFFKYGNAQRFAYEYGPGQWYQLGLYDSWTALGNADRSSSFLGDGAWHPLGIGFDFMYYGPDDRALYRDGSITRFSYTYGPGQWSHYGTYGGWQTLSNIGLSQDFIGAGGSLQSEQRLVVRV